MTAGTLAIDDVHATYGARQAIRGVSLPPLHAGELVAIVGPNGAGKTTLLKAIGGLIAHEGGVMLGGQRLQTLSPRHRAALVGYMPQLLPAAISLSVLESVVLTLEGSAAAPQADAIAVEVLERFALTSLALKPLRALSGGERQMAAFAQAVACDPALLLLDEPVSALDPARQFLVMQSARHAADEGRIVLIVLHDLALACQWADRLVILRDGRLHTCARPVEAVTPKTLRDVYGIDARVEPCSLGRVQIMTDGLHDSKV